MPSQSLPGPSHVARRCSYRRRRLWPTAHRQRAWQCVCSAITTRLRTPRLAARRGCLTSLAWSASGWAHRPRRLVLSVSSPRRAACTTTSRARWRTAPWSTPSSPPPTASSGWSLESRGLEAPNRDQGAHGTGTAATVLRVPVPRTVTP